jgi:hypothetical protein
MTKVRAVVVAVERYEVGKSWDLDGPAQDACRYVGWLRGRGVPPSAITLLASPLAENRAALDKLHLPLLPAEQAVVYEVLTKDLPADDADSLIMIWGGHGAVDGENNRRLFYADATERDKRNLDFNALMRALMTPYFPNQRYQLLVVDACQNLTSELRFVSRLPHQTLPDMPSLMPDREQHVLVAASPGQVALNDSTRRTGLFSAELLRILADPATAWPPDAGRLADRLDARFADLRADGTADQRPPYLWQRTPTREGVVFSMKRAKPGRLTLAALGSIVNVMLDVDELANVSNLQNLINLLPPDIRGAVPYTGNPRVDIIKLLRTCEAYSEGREALVGVLNVGMLNRADLARVLETLDQHWPTLH